MHTSAFLPYTQKTGVKVVEGTFGDEVDIVTKVKTSNPGEFNVMKEEVESLGVKILLDPRYKGKVAGDFEMQQRVWYAALQSGQDPNNIVDLDAVWDKARQSRDQVKKKRNLRG